MLRGQRPHRHPEPAGRRRPPNSHPCGQPRRTGAPEPPSLAREGVVVRDNAVKQKLQNGGVAMGVMCMEFATPGFGRLSAEGGAEFAVFDMEHTGWSLETVKMLVATSRATDMVPIVRVPTTDYHHIAHVLDV